MIRFVRSLKDSTIQIHKKTLYIINFQFNKRNKLFENRVWTNTAPLILTK